VEQELHLFLQATRLRSPSAADDFGSLRHQIAESPPVRPVVDEYRLHFPERFTFDMHAARLAETSRVSLPSSSASVPRRSPRGDPFVRAPTRRGNPLNREYISTIGLRSGLEGDNSNTLAPALSIASVTSGFS
jgi:hypothetical protein